MAELLPILKSYWWLIIGICGLIAWAVNVFIGILSYRQQGDEYFDRQMNRRFWRWFGIGAAVSLLVHLYSNTTDQVGGIDHETPLDEKTD